MTLHQIPRLGLTLLLLFVCASALARHHGHFPRETDTGGNVGVFDYYLLSLSWSPTYCLTHGNDTAQCGSKGYGFVLHGLWPDNFHGRHPENCATTPLLATAIRFARTIFPTEKLIYHEWKRHGTCSGLSPLTYFETADRVRTQFKIPPNYEAPATTQMLPAAAIVNSFEKANPTYRHAIAVSCSGPELAEVRVCLDKTLLPTSCHRNPTGNCRDGDIRVPSIR